MYVMNINENGALDFLFKQIVNLIVAFENVLSIISLICLLSVTVAALLSSVWTLIG